MTPQAYGEGFSAFSGKKRKIILPVPACAARTVNEKYGTMSGLLRARLEHRQVVNFDHQHERAFLSERAALPVTSRLTCGTFFRSQNCIRVQLPQFHCRQTEIKFE
jgi:hypothetical protein